MTPALVLLSIVLFQLVVLLREDNSATLGFPMARTIEWPLKSSHTSLDVNGMSSISASARFSLAQLMKDLAPAARRP